MCRAMFGHLRTEVAKKVDKMEELLLGLERELRAIYARGGSVVGPAGIAAWAGTSL